MGHHLVWYLQFRFRTLPNPCRALPFLFPPVQVPKFILLCLDNHPYRCYPHFPCNQIYLVLMKPSERYWTWFYLVVCWFTFTLQNNATMHIPATTCLRLVVKHLCIANPGWDWVTPLVSWLKITFFFLMTIWGPPFSKIFINITFTGWWFGTWILFFHILGRIFPTD